MRRKGGRVSKAVAIAALVGGVLLGGSVVAAQEAEEGVGLRKGNRFRLSFGAFRAEDETARDGAGEVWPRIGLEYQLSRPNPARFVDTSLFVDYVQGNHRERLYQNQLEEFTRSFYGAGLVFRVNVIPQRQSGSRVAAYLLAGGGAYYLQRSRAYIYEYDDCGCDDDDDDEDREVLSRHGRLNAGYKLGAGMRIGSNYFVEVTHYNLGSLGRIRYNGLSASFGLLF